MAVKKDIPFARAVTKADNVTQSITGNRNIDTDDYRDIKKPTHISINNNTNEIQKHVHISSDNGIIMMSGTARKKGVKPLTERRTARMNLLLPPSVVEWARDITAEQRYSLNDMAIEAFQLWAKAHGCTPYTPPSDYPPST